MATIDDLAECLAGKHLFVLAGAGCSTESGIPDYRGPGTLQRARNPIQYRAFIDDEAARRRYWARSAVGWPAVRDAKPNPAHDALVMLERAGLIPGIVTQNVDGLHQAAGNVSIVELHGALREVTCLDCGQIAPREDVQQRILSLNGEGSLGQSEQIAPDGDVDLDPTSTFRVPDCLRCGGTLKPNVVFFGENVPRSRVEQCYRWLDRCEALLVVGSSLTVFSGYRFVKRAHERAMPVGILTIGPTRADALASVKVDARLSDALPAFVERITGGARERAK